MVISKECGNIIEQLCLAVTALDGNTTLSCLNQALKLKIPSHLILHDGLCKGMEIVGRKCEAGEYFFPQLVDFLRTLETAMAALKPSISPRIQPSGSTIVIGVIEGDIHDIGKNIVKSTLSSYGFRIVDLGKDVAASVFIESAIKENARIICISTSLKTTMAGISNVLNSIRAYGLKDKIKVVVGGESVSEEYASEIGADGYAPNAAMAINVISTLISNC